MPEAPFEGRLNRQTADAILDVCLGDPGLAERIRQSTGGQVIRRQVRSRSKLQQVVHSAVKSGLMRRDKKGRFIGLTPNVRAQMTKIKARNRAATQPTAAERRILQRETLQLLKEA